MKPKKRSNKKLSEKFVSSFFYPFFAGTILSILLVMIMFPLSPNILNSSETIQLIIMNDEFKKTLPLILSGIYSINHMFQLYINNLIKIQSYYTYNSKLLLESKRNKDDKSNIYKIINKFSFNGVNTEEINTFHNLYKKYGSKKDYLLNQVKWFINPEKTELNFNSDQNIINQLFSVINLLPLFKTILNLTDKSYSKSEVNNQLYMMFGKTELFVKYPIIYNNLFGQDLKLINNPSNCKTKTGKFPEYYYFKCRPYYSYLLKEVEKGYNISISNIYKFLNGNYGLTICIQFPDIVTDTDEVVTLCHDLDMNLIKNQLDSINNNIPGYLFLMKVGSEVPIYYPVEFTDSEYINLANMEFSKNEYYNDEISLFIKNMPILIKEYKYSNDTVKNMISFDISKNNEKYNYTLFPIFFEFTNNQNSLPKHLLTLVYVNPYDRDFDVKYLYSTLLIVVIYFLMECFLLLLCRYLIISIAKNIVMPIKIIKDSLEQDFEITTNDNIDGRDIYNNKTTNSLNDNNVNNQIKNISKEGNINSSGPKSQKNINLDLNNSTNLIPDGLDANDIIGESNNTRESLKTNKENRNSNLKLKLEDDNDSSEDDNSSFDNEDNLDKTKYRSNNIQQLFMKLVDLKNAFKCLEDNKLSNDKLSNLVYAQNVFDENKNLEASSLCESNISSLFVKTEQFDKAISHLYNGIENINRKIFTKPHGKNKENKINIDELKKKIKTENLLNRYIKLFYCYKQYFKHVKKKYKLLQTKSKNKKYNFNPDINSFYITHHINIYKKCLDDYIYRVKEFFGGKDLCIGLLEKLEEKITFELSFFKEINKEKENYYYNIKNDINTNKKEKENIITEIFELFKEVDKLNSNHISINNYNVVHLINLLKYDSDIVNAMDIPPSILIQKTNFLKGKFHLKCYDYKQAIEYFEDTLDYEKIGDIEITINALKYLIKIANVYKNLVDNDIEFHSHQNKKNKIDLEEDKKRKKVLNNFIDNLNKEIQSYTYKPKDICIILNLGNLSGANNLNITEKFSNIKKIIKYIYEDITTNKDRIAILEYKNNNYRFFLSLKLKDEKSEKKISEVLENIQLFLYSSFDIGNKKKAQNSSNILNLTRINSINSNNSIKNKVKLKKNSLILQYNEKEKNLIYKNSDCLFDSVKYCNGYLKMKKNNNIKNDLIENWIFFLTCGFEDYEINEITEKPINNNLFVEENKNDNLIVVFYENISDKSKVKLKNWINYNKSDVLLKDQLEKLKDIMGTKGERQKIHFELEKYKDKF